jgi:hypothetical protein
MASRTIASVTALASLSLLSATTPQDLIAVGSFGSVVEVVQAALQCRVDQVRLAKTEREGPTRLYLAYEPPAEARACLDAWLAQNGKRLELAYGGFKHSECSLEGELAGKISFFEYMNFSPDHCRGIAFRVERFANRSVGNDLWSLLTVDPATSVRTAQVHITADRMPNTEFPSIVITSVRLGQ